MRSVWVISGMFFFQSISLFGAAAANLGSKLKPAVRDSLRAGVKGTGIRSETKTLQAGTQRSLERSSNTRLIKRQNSPSSHNETRNVLRSVLEESSSTAVKASGNTCSSPSTCSSNFTCSNGVCKPVAATTCSTPSSCSTNFTCSNGVCQPTARTSCSTPSSCGSVSSCSGSSCPPRSSCGIPTGCSSPSSCSGNAVQVGPGPVVESIINNDFCKNIPREELPTQHLFYGGEGYSWICRTNPPRPEELAENHGALILPFSIREGIGTWYHHRFLTQSLVDRELITTSGVGPSVPDDLDGEISSLESAEKALKNVLSETLNPEGIICDYRTGGNEWFSPKHQVYFKNLSELTPELRDELKKILDKVEKSLKVARAYKESHQEELFRRKTLSMDPRSRRETSSCAVAHPNEDKNRPIIIETVNASRLFDVRLQEYIDRITVFDRMLNEFSTNKEHQEMYIGMVAREDEWDNEEGPSRSLWNYFFRYGTSIGIWNELGNNYGKIVKTGIIDNGTKEKFKEMQEQIKKKYGLKWNDSNRGAIPALHVVKNADSSLTLKPVSFQSKEAFLEKVLLQPNPVKAYLDATPFDKKHAQSVSEANGAPVTVNAPSLEEAKAEPPPLVIPKERKEIPSAEYGDTSKRKKVLFFHYNGCGPCLRMDTELIYPLMQQIKDSGFPPGVPPFEIIDIDIHRDAEKYGALIDSFNPVGFPTTIILKDGEGFGTEGYNIYRDGKEVKRLSGYDINAKEQTLQSILSALKE